MDILVEIYKTAANILVGLGMNETFLYQFGIFTVFFFIAKILFLNTLQFNLENRISKTTKLSGKAEELFKEAETLAQTYRKNVDDTYREYQSKMARQKEKIRAEHEKELKKVEKEVQVYLDEAKKKTSDEVQSIQKGLLASKDKLSSSLVEKIIQ